MSDVPVPESGAGDSPPRLRAAAACVACNKKKVGRLPSIIIIILCSHFHPDALFHAMSPPLCFPKGDRHQNMIAGPLLTTRPFRFAASIPTAARSAPTAPATTGLARKLNLPCSRFYGSIKPTNCHVYKI
jgi:hypothetical protein